MANRRPPRREGNAPARGNGPRRPARARPVTPAPRRAPEGEPTGEERLQKVLAYAGIGSRRACEEFILQGRVTVDGQVVRELGTKVDPRRQQVAVDGQKIHQERTVYFAVNKPKGYVSTNNDPSGRPRVVDLLPEVPQRVYTVGRLDEMSTGLIILTNDGELANKLAHPRFGVEKVYRAVVAGSPDREVLNKLVEGVWLAEGKVRAQRRPGGGQEGESTILEMVLAEGKNREVRRMLAKLGHKVMTLTRTSVGPVGTEGPGARRVPSALQLRGGPVPQGRRRHPRAERAELPTARAPAPRAAADAPRRERRTKPNAGTASEGPPRRPSPARQDRPRRTGYNPGGPRGRRRRSTPPSRRVPDARSAAGRPGRPRKANRGLRRRGGQDGPRPKRPSATT